jgi:hypothetical protein
MFYSIVDKDEEVQLLDGDKKQVVYSQLFLYYLNSRSPSRWDKT